MLKRCLRTFILVLHWTSALLTTSSGCGRYCSSKGGTQDKLYKERKTKNKRCRRTQQKLQTLSEEEERRFVWLYKQKRENTDG